MKLDWIRKAIKLLVKMKEKDSVGLDIYCASYKEMLVWLEKQGEQKQHLELKAGHWYICHRAYCCRADHLTIKEGERFMCEQDGVAKGFVIKEPEKYFKEICATVDNVEPITYDTNSDQLYWKPTEEQLTELKNVFSPDTCSWNEEVLESLYNDLQKL